MRTTIRGMSPVTRYLLPVPCYNLPDTVRVRVILLLSRQLLDKLWSQVSSLSPPGTCLQVLSRIGFSIPTVRRFSSNVANSRSRVLRYSIFLCKKKTLRVCALGEN